MAASVDSVAQTAELKAGLQVGFAMVGEVDADAVSASTGALTGDRGGTTILHGAGFLLDPEGKVNTSLYASGPIGRFTASDVIRKVAFEKRNA